MSSAGGEYAKPRTIAWDDPKAVKGKVSQVRPKDEQQPRLRDDSGVEQFIVIAHLSREIVISMFLTSCARCR